jgi:hypothetical protein
VTGKRNIRAVGFRAGHAGRGACPLPRGSYPALRPIQATRPPSFQFLSSRAGTTSTASSLGEGTALVSGLCAGPEIILLTGTPARTDYTEPTAQVTQ